MVYCVLIIQRYVNCDIIKHILRSCGLSVVYPTCVENIERFDSKMKGTLLLECWISNTYIYHLQSYEDIEQMQKIFNKF